MPATDSETRTFARVSNIWKDPTEYMRINGVWVQRDQGGPVVPPPGGSSLAMSRGPTGSRWGPDALGADGALPRMPFPTYGTTSSASFTPFAQAADFFDSIGICTDPSAGGITTEAQMQLAIDRIQELGIRHVKALQLWSPAVKNDPTNAQIKQHWLANCTLQNAARSTTTGGPTGTGEHLIANMIGVDNEPEFSTNPNSLNDTKLDYAVFDEGGRLPLFRPIDGPPGDVVDFKHASFHSTDHTQPLSQHRQPEEVVDSPVRAFASLGRAIPLLVGPQPGNLTQDPAVDVVLPRQYRLREAILQIVSQQRTLHFRVDSEDRYPRNRTTARSLV